MDHTSSSRRGFNYSAPAAAALFMTGSGIILITCFSNIVLKELFFSWLLVFFNAYIGTFIANKALNQDFTGFFVWAMLINGLRIGIFLVILLIIIKMHLLSAREFAAFTLYGYLVFLTREVYTLHIRSLRLYESEQRN